jgi:SAM-dependent methyltransferase
VVQLSIVTSDPPGAAKRPDLGPVDLASVFHEVVRDCLAGDHDPALVSRGNATNPARHVAVFSEILEHLPEGGTFIDIGTGDGITPRMALKLGAGRVIVIDSERLSGTGDVEKLSGLAVEAVLATVGEEPVPLPTGTADVIFAGDVVEHLPHTPRPFMLELNRLLRPGGWLVLDTPNAVSLRTRLKMLMGVSNWTALEGIYAPDRNIYHHKEYTLDELRALFEWSAFETVRVSTYESFWQKSLKKKGRLQTMGLDSREVSEFGTGFNPMQPYEYARVGLLMMSKALPSLRSSLLAAGRKPV